MELAGRVCTPGGWVDGAVRIEGDRIAAIEGRALQPGEAPAAPFVLPGFIDLHVHGGGGADCMEGEDATRRLVRFHAANGTVAMTPTTSTAAAPLIAAALTGIDAVRRRPEPDGARVLGAHLEGPFINPAKLGAQEGAALDGDPALARAWAGLCPLRVATVAPEIPGGMAVLRALVAAGARVHVGHSLADDACLRAATVAGATGYTHLFNAMGGVDHRASGVAAFALAHAEHAELVCDGRHVHPTVMLAARRAIPKLYAITDAVGVAGLPDGRHATRGGRRQVIKAGFDITLADRPGTRAGSAITMADAFRTLAGLGVPLAEVSLLTATRQADYLGLPELGRIRVGAAASMVVLDAALQVAAVVVDGAFALAPAASLR